MALGEQMKYLRQLARIKTASRYIVVGLVTTFLCTSGTILLYQSPAFSDPAIANLVSTALVQPIAYLLHGKVTYGVDTQSRIHKTRFILFAIVALVVGFLCVRIAHAATNSYIWGLVVGWFAIPAVNYIIMTLWVFRSPKN